MAGAGVVPASRASRPFCPACGLRAGNGSGRGGVSSAGLADRNPSLSAPGCNDCGNSVDLATAGVCGCAGAFVRPGARFGRGGAGLSAGRVARLAEPVPAGRRNCADRARPYRPRLAVADDRNPAQGGADLSYSRAVDGAVSGVPLQPLHSATLRFRRKRRPCFAGCHHREGGGGSVGAFGGHVGGT